MVLGSERLLLTPVGDDLVAIDSFVLHNATACAYLAFQNDSPSSQQHPQKLPPGSLQQPPSLLTLQQLLNASKVKVAVPAVYKTCLSECILGTTDLETVLIGLSDLYEQVSIVPVPLRAALTPALHLCPCLSMTHTIRHAALWEGDHFALTT